MKKMKNMIFLLVLILMTGCSGKDGGFTRGQVETNEYKELENKIFKKEREKLIAKKLIYSQRPEILKFGLIGFTGNLNPFYATDDTSFKINSILYKNLYYLDYDEDGKEKITYDLLDSLDVGKDKKVFKLKLKNGLKWHDGSDLSSDDLLYTLEYLVKNKDTVYKDLMFISEKPARLKKIDDKSVEIELAESSNSFANKLSQLRIVSKKVFEGKEKEEFTANEKEMLVGSSAYAFVKYSIDETFNTEKLSFEYKSGSIFEEPDFKNIELVVSSNKETNKWDLEDYNMNVGYIKPNESRYFRESLFNISDMSKGFDASIVFKMANPNVSDREVREIITKILNPDSMKGRFATPNFARAADSVFSITSPFHKGVNTYFDQVEEADLKRLQMLQLEKKVGPLRFGFDAAEGEFQEQTALYLQEIFRSSGLKLQLVPMIAEDYNKAIENPETELFDFGLYKYKTPISSDDYSKLFKQKAKTDEMQEELENIQESFSKADKELDFDKRSDLYAKIQKDLYKNLTVFPLANVRTVEIIDNRLDTKEAIADEYGYFRFVEKIKMGKLPEVTKEELAKYNLNEQDLVFKRKNDAVTILNEKINAGKVK